MRATRRTHILAALGLSLLCLPMLRLAWSWPRALSRRDAAVPNWFRPAVPPPPRTPSARARWMARRYRVWAQQAVDRQRETLEAWDPATLDLDQEALRQQLMTADRAGYLQRARAQARCAATLARTPEEEYRSVELLARLECDAGHHQEELRLARTLPALLPRDERAWVALRHAAGCNHLEPLAQRASSAIQALEDPPGAH